MSTGALEPETGLRAPRKSLLNPIASAPFTDHKGNRATSAYYGKSPRPEAHVLPPQWSFHYYITFGATAETASTLPEDLVKATRKPVLDLYPLRLDVYFLPGASTEGCMEHYRGEMAARRSAPPPRNFIDPYRDPYGQFKLLAQIESVEWETTGATMVVFDATSRYDDEGEPPSTHIHRNVPWGDLDRFADSLGMHLHHMACATGEDDMNDAYHERLNLGHSDWV